jgi:multidrug efflux pump
MAAFGFSINNLTLFGLVLAIGIVVDDAIVVVENVERYLREGLSPRDAAYKTMEEVGGALIAIALVLCAVFIPTAFITGISGAFLSAVCPDHRRFDDHFCDCLADSVAGIDGAVITST